MVREPAHKPGKGNAFWPVDTQRRLFFALGHTVKLGECEPAPSFQAVSMELNHQCHRELAMSGWGVGGGEIKLCLAFCCLSSGHRPGISGDSEHWEVGIGWTMVCHHLAVCP